MHAINRARKERLLLSMLIPLVLSYGAYMLLTYHFMVLEPLAQAHDEVRNVKSNIIGEAIHYTSCFHLALGVLRVRASDVPLLLSDGAHRAR